VGLRHRLGLVNSSSPPVWARPAKPVYQWESGKRSPVFWLRIERLQRQLANSRPNGNA
jgi:hypothetical protein